MGAVRENPNNEDMIGSGGKKTRERSAGGRKEKSLDSLDQGALIALPDSLPVSRI